MAKDEKLDAIDVGRAAVGTGTATGQEALRRAGEEKRVKGKERGSTVKSTAPVPPADYIAAKGNKPMGAQKEPATFVGNGTVDLNSVASPSGPQPVSTVASTPEEAKKIVDKRKADFKTESRREAPKALDDDLIYKMSAAELRAVAHDRGYKISDSAGRRGTRAAFIQAQKDDKSLSKR
jgi:hypothetical protein